MINQWQRDTRMKLLEENVDSQELIAKDPAGKTSNTNMACYILINTIEGIQKHALLIKVGY